MTSIQVFRFVAVAAPDTIPILAVVPTRSTSSSIIVLPKPSLVACATKTGLSLSGASLSLVKSCSPLDLALANNGSKLCASSTATEMASTS